MCRSKRIVIADALLTLQQGNMGGSSKDWKREASPVSNPSLSRPHARVSRVFEVHMLTGVFSSLSYLILYSPLR